ncbi:MAG: restriction endonuclease, SacI family [Candidatus Zixiibacteriota bacterium]
MPGVDYMRARRILDSNLRSITKEIIDGVALSIPNDIQTHLQAVFTSHTQAYREVLLGCVLAKLIDGSINILLPYAEQGPNAFSGRTLDERVVNPFLHDNQIPCSRGPYLSVFRRNVRFDASTRTGLRDKTGYDALRSLLDIVASSTSKKQLNLQLRATLHMFVRIREQSAVTVTRLQRISLEQYDELFEGLLSKPSGGRFPALLALSAFTAIKEHYHLTWQIDFQGINVADAAAGVGGDITISENGRVLMSAEVTEREVDRPRIVATFTTKIAPLEIEDYLFLIKPGGVTGEAKSLARKYFSQGHEVNFLEIRHWLIMSLATLGSRGRKCFSRTLVGFIEAPDFPSTLKVAWNEQISRLVT